MSAFVDMMTAKLAAELLDGVTRTAVAQRLDVSTATIDGWIKRNKAPLPRSFPAIARFLKVPLAQMSEWFPEKARKEGLSRGRPLWGGERRGA